MADFPTFDGLDIKVTRAQVYSTAVFTAASGKEVRSTSQSAVRYRYTLQVNFLRTSGTDEVSTLNTHILANAGKLNTFTYVDPYSGGSAVTVRYDMDEFEIEKILSTVWRTATIKMIQVL